MNIRLLPQAESDLEIGADFYESQQAGLGSYFTDCLASDIESLRLYAGIHEKYLGFHRALSKRFPFAIYYEMTKSSIEIYAVLDCRQNPEKTDSALQKPRSDP